VQKRTLIALTFWQAGQTLVSQFIIPSFLLFHCHGNPALPNKQHPVLFGQRTSATWLATESKVNMVFVDMPDKLLNRKSVL
jgi:hypothetical protein